MLLADQNDDRGHPKPAVLIRTIPKSNTNYILGRTHLPCSVQAGSGLVVDVVTSVRQGHSPEALLHLPRFSISKKEKSTLTTRFLPFQTPLFLL
jgi:hypothetical protein